MPNETVTFSSDAKEVFTNRHPLLEIRVDDMDSVPTVFYKGEEIKGKCNVDYSWTTSDGDAVGNHLLSLGFYDPEVNKYSTIQTIRHERV